MKYVIVHQRESIRDTPKMRAIVFDEAINHCDVVPKGWCARSAGFVFKDEEGIYRVMTTMVSESLNKGPHTEDAGLLNFLLA